MTCFKNTNTLKSLLFVLVLLTVGGLLITVAEENLDDIFERPRIILQSSLEAGKSNLEKMSFFGNKEENCELEVRLGEKHEFEVFPFVSFPGSGNTWARMLLEKTTGIYTGSIYTDKQLVAGGFVGERTVPRNGETLFQKAHVTQERRMPDPKGFLFMMRNPFDASIAEWKRQNGQSHSAVKSEKIFEGEEWNEAAKNMLESWKVLAEEAIEIGKDGNLPFHLFFYEDLKANATKEMEKILDFIETEKVYFVSERDKRLRCLQKSLNETEVFHRPKTAPTFEYFSEEMIDLGNEFIEEVHEQLVESSLPAFYLNSYHRMKLFVMEKNF